MLNVLTILTFIGSAIGALNAIYSYATICNSITKTEEALSKVGSSGTMGKILTDTLEMAYKSCEMKLPLLIMNLVCVLLCFIGAIVMRKLNKRGFYIYLIGELVGPIGGMVLIGMSMGFMAIFGILIPIVFLILYGTQLKHMK